jgi:hypothetical protein
MTHSSIKGPLELLRNGLENRRHDRLHQRGPLIWSMLSDEILHYGQLLRDYLAWVRQSTNDPTFYIDFDLLSERLWT